MIKMLMLSWNDLGGFPFFLFSGIALENYTLFEELFNLLMAAFVDSEGHHYVSTSGPHIVLLVYLYILM